MEDCCAVCADPLEWVAYGSCGHRDVCSTCVVRLRFVLSDRRCCICKTECSTFFVTRALGSFTEAKQNFTEFPPDATEGQHGKYWYHEDSQTFFDDADHYRMISAMCRLACNICENNVGDLRRGSSKGGHGFKSIEQLKGHLYHQHRMFMCNLCLEGRKVFISEQKLYTISQLKQHESTGSLEVDGSETERGGFTGHPMCEFCKNPFYGDTELYSHMSTEHFTCHICQRKHPGHYEYYRNYDDLEIHFREEHFLCESEACLTKKFVVFQSDTEMKRHTVIEHGGHMSRAKRNAALQIPMSFKYRRNEQEHRRGRRHDHHHPEQSSNNQLTMAIQASLETAFAESRFFESSHGGRPNAEHRVAVQSDEVTGSRELLPISSISEPSSSRSIAANRHCVQNGPILQDKFFPPLSNFAPPEPSSRNAQAFSQTTNARLGEELFPPLSGAKGRSKAKKKSFSQCLSANTITSRANPRTKGTVKVLNSALTRPFTKNYDSGSSTSASSHIRLTQNPPKETPSSSPFVKLSGASDQAAPPSTSARQITQTRESRSDATASLPHVEDFRGANKSLVENIRRSLGMDEDRYLAFKSISAEYHQNLMNTWKYLSYVDQFSLSHLVFELAQLCPDAQKKKELINAYCASLSSNGHHGNSSNAVISKEDVKKGKEKTESSAGKEALADSIRTVKDKIPSTVGKTSRNLCSVDTSAGDLSSKREILTNKELVDGGVKKNKKMSKFLRARLGDALDTVSLDRGHRRNSPERFGEDSKSRLGDGVGVWGKGGGKKLFARRGP